MATQIKIGIGLAAGVVAAHAGWVIHARTAGAPQGKMRRFSPGSVDETVAFRLQTGDVVMFQRSCGSYALLSGLTCLSRQSRLDKEAKSKGIGATFDHVGVVVLKHGEPFLLEEGTYGPRLVRYDERIKCSHSKKVLVRPLETPLSKAAATTIEKWAQEITGNKDVAAAAMAGHPATGSAAKDHLSPFKEFLNEMRLLAKEQAASFSAAASGKKNETTTPEHDAGTATLRTVTGSSMLVQQALSKVAGSPAGAARTRGGQEEDAQTSSAASSLALQDFWPNRQPFLPALVYAQGDRQIWVRDLR